MVFCGGVMIIWDAFFVSHTESTFVSRMVKGGRLVSREKRERMTAEEVATRDGYADGSAKVVLEFSGKG
jgi:hypothetical protein